VGNQSAVEREATEDRDTLPLLLHQAPHDLDYFEKLRLDALKIVPLAYL
jgi:hypothetical protein